MWNTCHFMGQWPDSLKVLMQSGLGMDTETLRKPMGVEPGTCLQDPLQAVPLDTIMRGVGNPGLWTKNWFPPHPVLSRSQKRHRNSCVKARCAYKHVGDCRMWKMLAKAYTTPKRRIASTRVQKSSLALRVLTVCCWKHKTFCTKITKNMLRMRIFWRPNHSEDNLSFGYFLYVFFCRAGRFFENITFTQGGVKNSVVVSNIFYFHPIWGKNQFWLLCFTWVQTTNQKMMFIFVHQSCFLVYIHH